MQGTVERTDAVIGVQDAVFVCQAAGGFQLEVMVIAYRHVQSDGIVCYIRIRVDCFQVEGLHTADADPHGAVESGLSLCDDKPGFLQGFDVQRRRRDRDMENVRDLLEGQRRIFQQIQDLQTDGGGEGFPTFTMWS